MNGRLMLLHGLTPIHTGTGQSVDVIDLPVARETTTYWPYLPGSSLRGVLSEECKNEPYWAEAFGQVKVESDNADAGMLLFCDARLLCLPVRSFKGTFAWVTCPSVLRRLQRDLQAVPDLALPAIPDGPAFDQGMAVTDVVVHAPQGNPPGPRRIYLEDLDITPVAGDVGGIARALAGWAFTEQVEQDAFVDRFVLISDDLFTFLTETATEVTARIKIDSDNKTVEKGALWYEEALPAESLFWSLILATPRKDGPTANDLFTVLTPAIGGLLQIGGHAGVARGLVRAGLKGGA